MAERRPWSCKACSATLGWQSPEGLEVDPEAIERFTLPSRVEEIWVTCKQCGAVQVWRAPARQSPAPGGRWRMNEKPPDPGEGPPPRRGKQ